MNAPAFIRLADHARQRGMAAVELALMLTLLIPLLAGPVVIARSLLQANVAQRAVGNSARMVATYPLFQRQAADLVFVTNVRTMISTAMRQSGVVTPAWTAGNTLEVICDEPRSYACVDAITPQRLSVGFQMSILDHESSVWDMQNAFPPARFETYDRYAYASGQP